MKTAPFDLELALAGHPLMTRDGDTVFGFEAMNVPVGAYKYAAVINNNPFCTTFTEDGYYWKDCSEYGADLFLLVEDDSPVLQNFAEKELIEREIAAMRSLLSEATNDEEVKSLLTAIYSAECELKRLEK